MALDALQKSPVFLAPRMDRPEVIVDERRVLLMDPTDGSVVGREGPWGASGRLGRLVYSDRTPASRSF